MSVVGDNIRALRTLYGNGREITQGELADIIGVTRETVNKWEAGTIGNVRTSNIERLRTHFGLSVDDLRSESNGLAARLRVGAKAGALAAGPDNLVPLLTLAQLREGPTRWETSQHVEVPAHVGTAHERLVAFTVEDEDMARVLPVGAHAFMDPDLAPETGSVVVAQLGGHGATPFVRRLHRGSTKALLSAEGFVPQDDLIVEAAELRVLGTVVWFQASATL